MIEDFGSQFADGVLPMKPIRPSGGGSSNVDMNTILDELTEKFTEKDNVLYFNGKEIMKDDYVTDISVNSDGNVVLKTNNNTETSTTLKSETFTNDDINDAFKKANN